MARLTFAEQNWYKDNISKLANRAGLYTADAVNNLIRVQLVENGTIDIPQLRNDTIQTVSAITDVYGDAAKLVGNQMFDYVMTKEGSTKTAETYENDYDEEWIEQQIRYYMNDVIDGNNEKFLRELTAYVAYLVRRSDFVNQIKNAQRSKLRYARVPSGFNTCAFCMMLASRGFVYHTEKSAGGDGYDYHPHCHCSVICSQDGDLDIEGFDKNRKLYLDLYSEARENAEALDDTSTEMILKIMRLLGKERGWQVD